jgi:endothelin-converting enzyme/putative endopeptidase
MTRAELQKLAPQFDWPTYLNEMGFQRAERVIVRQPSAVQAAGKLLDEIPLETWRAWLAFSFIDSFSPYLSRPFQEAEFAFEGRALYGQREQHPRWSRAVKLIDATLGETVGVLYLDRHFRPRAAPR